MPGSVRNAAPAAVFPQSLSRAFVREQAYPVLINEYRNGESQRLNETTTSRKRWRLAKRLTPTQLQMLREFYEARNGPVEAFYFYDPYETVPKFASDPTGFALNGRYTVRFDSGWSQSCAPSRSDVEINLVELA
jgi:phage-related protein